MQTGSPSLPRLVLALVVLSFVIRLVLIWPAEQLKPGPDETQYLAGAAAIAETGYPRYIFPAWDEAHSAPVYPYFLGVCHAVFGPDGFRFAARVIQALLSALTVLLVHRIAVRAFDARTALVSAAITAVFPTFVAFSHSFLSETIYTFVLIAAAAALAGMPDRPSAPRVLAAGAIAGIAALTRSTILLQVPFILLWLVVRSGGAARTRWLTALLFVGGMAAVIAPWSIHNTLRYERFLLIDTNAGNVLYKNWNAIRPENHDVGLTGRWHRDRKEHDGEIPFRERVEEDHIVDRNNAEIRAAVAFVFSHPLHYLGNCVIRAAELVNPTSFLVRDVRTKNYRDWSPFWREVVVSAVVVSTMLVLLLGVWGLVGRVENEARLLLVLLIASHVALCVLIISMSRYRVPIMPLLIPFAVHGALHLRQCFERQHRARAMITAATVALMIWAWLLYVPLSY